MKLLKIFSKKKDALLKAEQERIDKEIASY